MMYVYEALIYPAESGAGYEAYVPDWDVFTVGDDFKDAVYMVHDLLELAIASALDEGTPVPEATFDHEVPQGARLIGVVVDGDKLEPEPECMDVAHASEILGVTVGRVHAMLRSGILTGHKEGNLWMVDVESVRDRANNPRPGGRPRRGKMQGDTTTLGNVSVQGDATGSASSAPKAREA